MGQHPAQKQSEPSNLLQPLSLRARNRVERFFNQIKQCRRVATRYDKLAPNYLAFVNLRRSGYGCALMSPRPSNPRGPCSALSPRLPTVPSWTKSH